MQWVLSRFSHLSATYTRVQDVIRWDLYVSPAIHPFSNPLSGKFVLPQYVLTSLIQDEWPLPAKHSCVRRPAIPATSSGVQRLSNALSSLSPAKFGHKHPASIPIQRIGTGITQNKPSYVLFLSQQPNRNYYGKTDWQDNRLLYAQSWVWQAGFKVSSSTHLCCVRVVISMSAKLPHAIWKICVLSVSSRQ